jgi:hypothetical protein
MWKWTFLGTAVRAVLVAAVVCALIWILAQAVILHLEILADREGLGL